MNNNENYSKITLSEGTILYHWGKNVTDLSDNLFLCLDNSCWSSSNKTMYKYKLVKNIDLILTIQNDNIIKNKKYSTVYRHHGGDFELLTLFYNNIFDTESYSDDVCLKTSGTNFTKFCNKLHENKIEGLFNYIDSDKGQFEIVIFKPNEYLNLIEISNYENVKLHELQDCKIIMLSENINYIYPYEYEYEDIDNIKYCEYWYPSIFYYIYKKRHLKCSNK